MVAFPSWEAVAIQGNLFSLLTLCDIRKWATMCHFQYNLHVFLEFQVNRIKAKDTRGKSRTYDFIGGKQMILLLKAE